MLKTPRSCQLFLQAVFEGNPFKTVPGPFKLFYQCMRSKPGYVYLLIICVFDAFGISVLVCKSVIQCEGLLDSSNALKLKIKACWICLP
jgi:hypothetical protein